MAHTAAGNDGLPDASPSLVLVRHTPFALIFAVSLSALACSGTTPSGGTSDETTAAPDHHDDASHEAAENLGRVSSPLNANDTVTTAVAQSCTTTAVKGLATQLVEEIQCMRPGTFAKIDNTPGLALGSAVFPYLQVKAAQALVVAQKARGTTMSINSALRTLPQQYLLYQWYQTGRCGIGLAASPGTSNHEGAIAVDIDDNAGWRASMEGKGFRWLGSGDPVHYDFLGGGTLDLHGVSVTAFQRLWNRNNPTDKIAEDGAYGPGTATRLAQSPANGFAKGADCKAAAPDAGPDAAGHSGSTTSGVPIIPDVTEGSGDPAAKAPQTPSTLGSTGLPAPSAEAGGCAVAIGTATTGAPGSPTAITLGIAAALAIASRRRRRRA